MKREVFKSNPFRGLPTGLLRGFMYGCVILLIGLALGMDEDAFIPMLIAFVILGGIIGIISNIGKRIEADANGIYIKKKEYLFAENDIYIQVHTRFYSGIPVTERYIRINGSAGKRTIKCTFVGAKGAGRLAKITEDAMREKYRKSYDDIEKSSVEMRTFNIPASELAETIDQRCRLILKMMFGFLTVLFSWMLISMSINDQLGEYGLGLLGYMVLVLAILGGVNLGICGSFKKSEQNIPREIVFFGGQCYIDGKSFWGMNIERVVMTPMKGAGTGNMKTLTFYEGSGNKTEYSFGFRFDQTTFPEYGQLVEAVKENFGGKFAYDVQ